MRFCEHVVLEHKDADGKPQRSFGWVCGSRRSSKRQLPPCEVCLEEYIKQGRPDLVHSGKLQCDHPVGGVDARGLPKTCDRYICKQHAQRVGKFDYCPTHRREINSAQPA